MGYSENKEPFTALARAIPLTLLRKQKSSTAREAVLFGASGFLPTQTLPSDAAPWLRKLWDEWWKMRDAFSTRSLPRSAWKLSGIRPWNRPERRLALLAALLSGQAWSRYERLVHTGDVQSISRFLGEMRHEFFDLHSTLRSNASRHRTALIGEQRIKALLFNVVLPLSDLPLQEVEATLRGEPLSGSNHSGRTAALRLLGKRRIPKSNLLVQEGLVQVYQDFCLQDAEKCGRCSFAGLVDNWTPQPLC